ncbi:MAG: hypothetical protein M3O50_11665 [Myxococcota bacterium]|nr:hypothetical protein [Myxococcota bacterium]
MRCACERLVAAGAAVAALLSAGALHADYSATEPSYGRLDGDVTFVLEAGIAIGPRNPRGLGGARLRYLDTAGWFMTYEDAGFVGAESAPQRVLATGCEMRPLFLFRWLRDYETKRPFFDLVVDSIGIELGAAFAQRAGSSFSSRPELQAGLGFEVPLSASGTGFWLDVHGGMRWSGDALEQRAIRTADDRAAYLAITLAWHQFFPAHVVDTGDVLPP